MQKNCCRKFKQQEFRVTLSHWYHTEFKIQQSKNSKQKDPKEVELQLKKPISNKKFNTQKHERSSKKGKKTSSKRIEHKRN